MPTHIALLRGVNVGNNILKMDQLRKLCTNLRFQNIQTYVQSGNIVFTAPGSPDQITAKLEKILAGETRLPVTVTIRTSEEISRILLANPFLKTKGIDTKRLHVTFLCSIPNKEALKTLAALNGGDDEFQVIGREIYIHCPIGYGQSKLTTTAFEKRLAIKATTRNWNTVNKLSEMASACDKL